MSDKEPHLIDAKGEMNTVAWSAWYRANNPSVNAMQTQYAFNERVQSLPEPELTTASGKPNPVWIKWYRLRKKVSSNVALSTCKKLIQAKAEGKPQPKDHRTTWW